jgi:hypothetical protein
VWESEDWPSWLSVLDLNPHHHLLPRQATHIEVVALARLVEFVVATLVALVASCVFVRLSIFLHLHFILAIRRPRQGQHPVPKQYLEA